MRVKGKCWLMNCLFVLFLSLFRLFLYMKHLMYLSSCCCIISSICFSPKLTFITSLCVKCKWNPVYVSYLFICFYMNNVKCPFSQLICVLHNKILSSWNLFPVFQVCWAEWTNHVFTLCVFSSDTYYIMSYNIIYISL